MSVAAVGPRRMPASWVPSLRAAGRTSRSAAGRTSPDTVAGVRARPHPGERRRTLAIVLGTMAVVLIALLLVWVRLQAVHTGYQLSAARHLAHRLEQEQRELELEIATLTSPRRLELLARERLGMGPPTPGQIVRVP